MTTLRLKRPVKPRTSVVLNSFGDKVEERPARAPRPRKSRKLIDVMREVEKAHTSLDAPQFGIKGRRRNA